MADIDQFEIVKEENKPKEEDPAAAFLAREQDELAGLEDDNFGVDDSAQETQDNLDPLEEPTASQDMWSGADGPENTKVADDNDLFGDDMMTGDGQGGGALFDTDTGSSSPITANGPSDSYSSVAFQDKERAVSEKILIWREEQLVRLEKKDAEEEEKTAEWVEGSKKEIDDWYKHHTEQLQKTKDDNRAAEEVFVKERDQMEPGDEWEKICRLCEFNPKNSKNTKDVSRMRSILLQLKQTPLIR